MRRLADRFVVLEPLGAGGMGSIFRARDERLGQDVAIKILKRSLMDDAVLRERFRREARALARLRHPGIVAVLDLGEDEGDLWTALELVRGETLERVMQRDGAMPIGRAAAIADRLLDALEACHAAEIVHRDVKASNVMIDGDAVKLIDFGLARVAQDPKLTETGAVQGTPSAMSPEQCRGEEVGPASDVYSMGVLLFAMLAGAEPFRGADAATLMAQHLFVEPPPLVSVSAGVSATVRAALAKRAEDRPTARELREALARAMAGEDPEARTFALAAERVRDASLPRSERAIGDASAPKAHDPTPATVCVWMTPSDRAASLRAALGAAGLAGATSPADANVVIASARDGLERVRALRTSSPKLPIVVVDVEGPDETTAAIRAGANDMLLADSPDAELPPKLARLLRRRP
ncbi:MAG TPA: serine/threonine-protein kinase [Labilithrix sp.]